jgi:hypothetical protein
MTLQNTMNSNRRAQHFLSIEVSGHDMTRTDVGDRPPTNSQRASAMNQRGQVNTQRVIQKRRGGAVVDIQFCFDQRELDISFNPEISESDTSKYLRNQKERTTEMT